MNERVTGCDALLANAGAGDATQADDGQNRLPLVHR
jgi:hypothetical protein